MSLSERINGACLDRRTFVAAGAGLGALALSGCQPSGSGLSKTGGGDGAEAPDPALFETEGKWIPAGCWLNCGGRCYNAAYVVDGVVKYQKTDDVEEDSLEYPQLRGCVRGRSQRYQVYAPDRIKYPMKRKNWSPDNPNKELRGKDEWERISWEEALDYVADQMKKTIAEVGNRGILLPTFSDRHSTFYQSIYAMGGKTGTWDSSSLGAYMANVTCLGLPPGNQGASGDRFALGEADTIVLMGCNQAWAAPGNPVYWMLQAKEQGTDFVYVGPSKNVSASMLDARWIPVRPGTDIAFLLGVAYVMLSEDDPDTNPLIDWDFLDRCTVGFDAEHMPEDAKINENFKDYVLGAYDGTPKTPEWASAISGTPTDDIEWFAHLIGVGNKVSMFHSFAVARSNNADDVPQMLMTIGAMGGHYGRPGETCSAIFQCKGGNEGNPLVKAGATGLPPVENPVDDVIVAPEVWDAVLTGKYKYQNAAWADPTTVEERDIDIRMIWHAWRNNLQTIPGTAKGIEAHRKVDFVVTQGFDWNLSAKFSDIVLPVTTQWERMSVYYYMTFTNKEYQLFPSQVIDPLWEAKDDVWIGEQLMTRLGVDPTTAYPFSEKQGYFNLIKDTTVINEAGTDYEPLVTITQEDIDEWGVEGEPQEGIIALSELMEKGKYQVRRKADDNYGGSFYAAFREDPEGNPRDSKSGKLEIYCQTKADAVNAMGRGELKPYPTYQPALHGFEETQEGTYPYQVYNPHYLRRGHTGFDNVPQLREVWPNPVFINASDAAAKGVKDGDTVLLSNYAGKCLRTASLLETIMPGVIALPHGTWCDIDEETGIDYSGSDNYMLPHECSTQGVSGYNTNVVDFEKWEGEALPPDCEKVFEPAGGIEGEE